MQVTSSVMVLNFRRVLKTLVPLIVLLACIVPSILRGQNSDPLLAQADSLRLAAKFDAALPLYDRFLTSSPDNRDALYGRGIARMQQNRIDEGIADMRRAVELDPDCARCYFWLARAASVQGKVEEGLQRIAQAFSLDSNDADFWVCRALLQSSQSAALDDFNRAVELKPNDPTILSDRANFYLTNSSPMMALQDINSALALDSTYAYGYFLRANIYQRRNDGARALQEVSRAINLGYHDVQARWMRGMLYEEVGMVDSALADYSVYLEQNPTRFEVLHSRALLRYKKEDMDGSCRDLDRVLELIGDNEEAHAIAIVAWNGWCDSSTKQYYYHRGIAQFNLGDYARAVEWHEKGIKKFPESAILRSFRGNAALALGRYPLVVQDYEYVLSRFDQYFEEWWASVEQRQPGLNKNEIRLSSLGQAYSMLALAKGQMGEFDRALVLMDSAIAVEPNPVARYNQRGLINMWAGEWKKAIKDFETSLSFVPDYPDALGNRAVVYLLQATTSQTRTTTTFSLGFTGQGGRTASSAFPISERIENVDLDLVKAARADLDRVIAKGGSIGQAYEYRAYARKLLGDAKYCEDITIAKTLGPLSGLSLTPECR